MPQKIEIHTTLWAAPISADKTVQAVVDAVNASAKWTAWGGTGSADGVFPQELPVRFVLAGSWGEADARATLEKAAKENTGFFGAWGEFRSQLTDEVIVPTIEQAKDAASVATFWVLPLVVVGIVGIVILTSLPRRA